LRLAVVLALAAPRSRGGDLKCDEFKDLASGEPVGGVVY